MQSRLTLVLATLVAVQTMVETACADNQLGCRYPTVYGPTGRPYGPTQAHYQYMRQYGRTWHGYGGIYAHHAAGCVGSWYARGGGRPHCLYYPIYYPVPYSYPAAYFNYFPFWSVQVLPSFGIWYGVSSSASASWGTRTRFLPWIGALASVERTASHAAIQSPKARADALHRQVDNDGTLLAAWARSHLENSVLPPQSKTRAAHHVSNRAVVTADAREESVKYRAQGDGELRRGNMVAALIRYNQAIKLDSQDSALYFRRAFVLAGMKRYDHAVQDAKRGIEVDPLHSLHREQLANVLADTESEWSVTLFDQLDRWVDADRLAADRQLLHSVLLCFDRRSNTLKSADGSSQMAERSSPLRQSATSENATSHQLKIVRNDLDAIDSRAPSAWNTVPPAPAP